MSGCSSTATIVRGRDALDAEVVASAPDSLTVEDYGWSNSLVLPGCTVTDIDHPGNVKMVVGAVLLAIWVGALSEMGFSQSFAAHGDATPQGPVYTMTFAVPGALLLGTGSFSYVRSRRAARHLQRRPCETPAPAGLPGQ